MAADYRMHQPFFPIRPVPVLPPLAEDEPAEKPAKKEPFSWLVGILLALIVLVPVGLWFFADRSIRQYLPSWLW